MGSSKIDWEERRARCMVAGYFLLILSCPFFALVMIESNRKAEDREWEKVAPKWAAAIKEFPEVLICDVQIVSQTSGGLGRLPVSHHEYKMVTIELGNGKRTILELDMREPPYPVKGEKWTWNHRRGEIYLVQKVK